ncbi:MAG: hypothetical protein AUK47_05035 [Deltaproteobacteria bacterium CG2_30_63_29]|nr:MAG: hypothetical protein AUK47_05035 [Deltaproteobacteria bacterium CG2_30_63_29]PJB40916.1 MAG: hypothetical protein CO108_13900 [Deltaproteobacteria bacterium CG_4_9_14_3_um_filter_63_12]
MEVAPRTPPRAAESLSATPTIEFTYGIGRTLLLSGSVLTGLALVWFLFAAGDASILLWAFGLFVAVIFVSSSLLALNEWRHGPRTLRLNDTGVELPEGLFVRRLEVVPWQGLTAIRIIGRTTLTPSERDREALYLLHDGTYAVLMSDLFLNHEAYAQCRDAIVAQARSHVPQLRVDRDGQEVPNVSDAS